MILDIIICVSIIGLLILGLINSIIEYHEHKTDCFLHETNYGEKWILCLDDCLLTKIRGDFWIGYIPSEKLPFSVNCGKGCIGRYDSEEKCRQVINEISIFLNKKDSNVFVMP